MDFFFFAAMVQTTAAAAQAKTEAAMYVPVPGFTGCFSTYLTVETLKLSRTK